MALGSIVSADYKIALFLHVLAVVLAFGPSAAYSLMYSVIPQHPRSAPAILSAMERIDRYLINPGMIVVLLAGIYLLVASDDVWGGGDAFIVVGFLAIIALFGLQHAYFAPKTREAKQLAERDLKAGDTLSAEFETLGRQVGRVGGLVGAIIVVTIFFMTYKPFM